MVDYLVNVLQVDIHAKNKDKQNVVHMAAMGDQPATLVYFVRIKEMAIDSIDAKSRTPLHWAVHCYGTKVLEYILAHD